MRLIFEKQPVHQNQWTCDSRLSRTSFQPQISLHLTILSLFVMANIEFMDMIIKLAAKLRFLLLNRRILVTTYYQFSLFHTPVTNGELRS
jgi:hypothetical protein